MQVNEYIKLGGIALGATAGVFVSYKIYKSIQAKRTEKKALNEYKKEVNTSNLQHSPADFATMADAIYSALNQTWNDDEEAVYNVLRQLKNKDEWLALVKAFGLRKRGYDWFEDKMRLPAYIANGLETWEMKKVRDILSKIGVAV